MPRPQETPTQPFYKYEVYLDGEAGWTWAASSEGRVLVISTNHESEFAASVDVDTFKSSIRE